jgi:hypothetical protein
LFSGYTINILGDEDQNSHWCKEYSYYSSPFAQKRLIWASGIARAACVPEVFSCKEGVSWSPSTQNELIWTSQISRAGYVPEVFDCKEVVSWCVLTFSFRLFFFPYNIFSLLPRGKIVTIINFTMRMGSYVLLNLKNSGFLSYWGGSFEQCCRMSCSWQWWLWIGNSSQHGIFVVICTIQWCLTMSLGPQHWDKECFSPASSQRIIPLRNHSPFSLLPRVFYKILRL